MPKKELETSLVIPATTSFVERRIYVIRGQKVMLDTDLAELYQVLTKNLNLSVKRNIQRFPSDFMFQLNSDEYESLRLQIETSNVRRGGRRYFPYVFTELGVAMLSSVLNSDRAVQMNICIMRTFVKLRELAAIHGDLAEKIIELEKVQGSHAENLADLNLAVTKLIEADTPNHDAIGFEI